MKLIRAWLRRRAIDEPPRSMAVQSTPTAEEMYRVILPFRAVEDYVLPVPFDVPSVHVDSDGKEYLATVEVSAISPNEALEVADLTLRDLLACFAVRAASYVLVDDLRRIVQLADPEPVADGPVPPFQTVGGILTEAGAEQLDPAGELRRQRRIVNLRAAATVIIGDVSQQKRWFVDRRLWSDDLRRAMTVLHAAECAQQAEIRFVLLYFAFEILTAPWDKNLLVLRTPNTHDRAIFKARLMDFVQAQGYSTPDAGRWVNSVANTQAVSPIDSAHAYVMNAGMAVATEELKWLRAQRSAYVHDGHFERSQDANDRRERFRQLVRTLVQRELDLVG
jgi:hypothetical protein